ncbi:MAG TPA: hypothetical protein VFW98_14230 [Gemmatimonadaceae bacterium]|nr:hypothetical protein [Gemmatimonadaceae bacterium]
MAATKRQEIEQEIEHVLLEQWDPLNVHLQPGPHANYDAYAPDLYSLLARGGSDVQVARHLHQIEHQDFGGPEPPTRDLRGVLQSLRAIEHRI